MRFAPGTSAAQRAAAVAAMKARSEARQRAMSEADNRPRPQTQPRPPVPPDLQTPMPRPATPFMPPVTVEPFMPPVTVEPFFPRPGTPFTPPVTVAPSFGQPPKPGPFSVGRPPPQQPNVMGFPDMDPRLQQFAGRFGQEAMQQLFGRPNMPGSTFGNQQAPMMTGPKSAQTTPPPVGLPAIRGAQDPMGSQQAAQQAAGAALQGFANKAGSFFKKGGAVTTKAKAPVKKAAGGKVAAKAPVKKAMGGPIKAKTAAKPAAKMAKPMPAMKRGGKVMAKGRKK